MRIQGTPAKRVCLLSLHTPLLTPLPDFSDDFSDTFPPHFNSLPTAFEYEAVQEIRAKAVGSGGLGMGGGGGGGGGGWVAGAGALAAACIGGKRLLEELNAKGIERAVKVCGGHLSVGEEVTVDGVCLDRPLYLQVKLSNSPAGW